jgi:hypothetical protein
MTSETETAIYRRALERAAAICEEQAKQFLDPAYAVGQPMGSFAERFACSECATAIRAEAIITPAGRALLEGEG